MKILLGWCLISLIGTLVALRLIRNGKNHRQPDQLEETQCCDQNQPAIAPHPTQRQQPNIAHQTEHLR